MGKKVRRIKNATFPSFLIIRHPRVHSSIEEIGDQVDQNEDQAEKENASLNRG
jgi:hypothetical protein